VTRTLHIAAAQMGPNQESATRAEIVGRMLALLEQAVAAGVEVLVYPELALTTYFPKRIREDYAQFFDEEMPNASVEPLFRRAREAGIAFHLGYAERTAEGRCFNTAVYVDESGEIVHRYRKLHLPGLRSTAPEGRVRVYEPHFFSHGDTGFTTFATRHATMGISICQDRRYPESYRALGLRGAQVVLTGYNTPASPLALSQNELSLRAGAYENSLFVVGVAKAGVEDGVHLIGGSCVVDPHGQVIAHASTEDDELVSARVDLDQVDAARERWNFYGRRHPEHYGVLVEPVSVDETRSRHR
jgi:predicted amidohydrolase